MDKRGIFWGYCIQVVYGARERSKKKNIPFSIDAYYLDQLLVDQGWRCAVSGIPLVVPRGTGKTGRKKPFGPSLDRIVPSLGYVPGNLRIVNNIVNTAMSDWGLDTLLTLVEEMSQPRTERDQNIKRQRRFKNRRKEQIP